MGSSIEAAITMSAIILILTAFIILPIGLFISSLDFARDTVNSINLVETDYSVENFCTFISGMSEAFRIALGGV